VLVPVFVIPSTRDDSTRGASRFPPPPTNAQFILSSPSLILHGADFFVPYWMTLAFFPVVNSVLPKRICTLLKINFLTLFTLWSISYFNCWYFISSWNQNAFYIVVDSDARGSMFVTVLSVPINNKHWHCNVNNLKLLTSFRALFKRCPSLRIHILRPIKRKVRRIFKSNDYEIIS
jgi:hypothetical protein